jgi:hypothetical protein
MVPPFHIFKRQGGWQCALARSTDLEAAKQQVKELLESMPGEYFIFGLATGRRLDINRDDVGASTETRK